MFAPDARPHGLGYEDWAIRYLQWSLAFPATANPAADTAPPDTAQPRGVWFLPTVTGDRTVTRQLSVPAHTPLLLSAGATLEPNVARGIYLRIKPLSVGEHTVRIVGIAGPRTVGPVSQ